ncbi:hypothetical protein [uncultured Chitinophaga sp.]|uniref:hypothetical protein n=1 Tax=uncultured Chitinophaga sp. TaxID=339340 RepID=UPI00262754B3|nr:hypothetical protein [uncultured Chitinophaga sp.]
MRRLICFLPGIFLVLLTATVYAQKEELPLPGWATTPVTADGDLAEWPTSLRYIDDQNRLTYDIFNDGENLYLAVSTTDEITQVNILRGGLTFAVNIKGKRKETTSVTYPQIAGSVLFAQRRNSNQANGNSRYGRPSAAERPVPADLYRELRPHMNNAGIIGITGLSDGTIDVAQRKTGIAAETTLTEGDSLNLEFVIPLSKLGITAGYAKDIAYGIAVNESNIDGGGRSGRRGGGGISGVGFGLGVGGGSYGSGIGGGIGIDLGSIGGGRRNGGGGGGRGGEMLWVKQKLAKGDQ